MRSGIFIIDADGHVAPEESVDWAKYMPQACAQHATDIALAAIAAAAASRAVSPELQSQGFHDKVEPYPRPRGGWNAQTRLEVMAREGIDVSLLLPTIVASGGTRFQRGLEISHGYNNWLAEFCSAAPDRLKGVAAVALIEDLSQATQEMKRCVETLGFVGVVARAHNYGKTLAHPGYSEMFAQAEVLDIPILVHIGSQIRELLAREFRYPFTHAFAFGHPASSMLALMDIIYGGWLERTKTLRFALLEGDIGWLPFWIHRLDALTQKRLQHAPLLSKLPSEYLEERRVFVACEPEEGALAHAIDAVAEDMVVYGSMYPQWDASVPGGVDRLLGYEGLTWAQKAKLLGGNARALLSNREPALPHLEDADMGLPYDDVVNNVYRN